MGVSKRQKDKLLRAYDVSICWDYINIFSTGLWMRKIEFALKNARQKESYRQVNCGGELISLLDLKRVVSCTSAF
jgi:hypothetical protein